LVAEVVRGGFQIRVGISSASREVDALRKLYYQAENTLTTATAIDKSNHKVWVYEDLGFLGDLLTYSQKTHNFNRYIDVLEKIEQYDHKKNTKYLQTLEIYLDYLGNANQAAQALFIHRNTLYQRLAKISDLWGIDFKDPLIVINLNLAIKALSIRKYQHE
jgi:PucR family transcriptional regulator, purine catabolism regulatory protein